MSNFRTIYCKAIFNDAYMDMYLDAYNKYSMHSSRFYKNDLTMAYHESFNDLICNIGKEIPNLKMLVASGRILIKTTFIIDNERTEQQGSAMYHATKWITPQDDECATLLYSVFDRLYK